MMKFLLVSLLVGNAALGITSLSKRERTNLGVLLGLNSTDDIVILEVIPNSPAAKGGLVAGDTIHKINGSKVSNLLVFIKTLEEHDPGKVNLEVSRGVQRKPSMACAPFPLKNGALKVSPLNKANATHPLPTTLSKCNDGLDAGTLNIEKCFVFLLANVRVFIHRVAFPLK